LQRTTPQRGGALRSIRGTPRPGTDPIFKQQRTSVRDPAA